MRVPSLALARSIAGAFLLSPLLLLPASLSVARLAVAPGDELVVSTSWLAAHLKDPSLVILEVTDPDGAPSPHIPGARQIAYMDITTKRDGLGTELPPVEQLRAAFEKLGVSDSSHVVVYAPEAPMATRVLFTLDYLGVPHFSLLDGGLTRWRAEKRPVVDQFGTATPGHLTPHPHPEKVVDAAWISARQGRPGLSLIDTRTDGEYLGTGERHGMPSFGHLAGAHQLQWEQLFQSDSVPLLRSRAELEKLYGDRTRAGDTVVTYCWVGYRASATYFAARYLGLPVKLYDGSYQDWLQRKLPVKAGTEP